MWLGVDDTDSPRGGCTTYVLSEILRTAREHGLDVLGEPRLVRLNPNVPYKTRGNAALAVRLGHGTGPRRWVARVDGRGIRAAARGSPPSPAERTRFLGAAWEAVLAASRVGEPGVDPALVAVGRALPPELYRRAVREVVPLDEVEALLRTAEATTFTAGSRRGLVGAAAAIAWPARRATWELTAYRAPERWGTPRSVDPASVVRAQKRFPDLFLCADGRTRRLLVAPHSACPILFGLRSRRREVLGAAARVVRSEPVDRWVVFRTNQGTGDHLARRLPDGVPSYGSARVRGVVGGAPTVLPGGHVRFEIVDGARAPLVCLAFEPTKTLPRIARALLPGDGIEVWGGRSDDPLFRVEGIRVVTLGRSVAGLKPPECPACGRPMGSLGRVRGYRCRRCRTRRPPEAARPGSLRSVPAPGVYHPTPSARRHLAPLGPEVAWPSRPGTDL